MIKNRIIFISFFLISLNILRGQAITSLTVLNGSFITTIDTVFLRVVGGFSNLGGVTSKSVSVSGNVVTATINGCTTGLSTITFIDEVVKINPLSQGTYKIKAKLIEYDNFVFPGCNVQKSYNSDSLNITVVTYTGLNKNLALLNNIRFFPNPAKNKILVEYENSEFKEVKISIYNSMGQCVYLINNFTSKQEVDLTNLPAGLFYMQIEKDLYQKTSKLFKE